MLIDDLTLTPRLSRYKARMRAGSTLAVARVVGFVLASISAAGTIPSIMTSSAPSAVRLAGAVAGLALAGNWLIGLRRGRFELAAEPLETAAVFLILAAAPGHPLLPLCGLLFRSLYGNWFVAVLRCAGWSAALLGASLLQHAGLASADPPRVFALMLATGAMNGLSVALARLEASEQRLGSLIEHSADIVTVLDADARISWQASSIRTVLGCDPMDWLGTRFADHVHPDDRAKLAPYLQAVNQPGFSEMLELRLRDSTGRIRWFEIAASNRLHDPNVHGYVLNIRDATDRRRLERERTETERLRERIAAEREKHELQARLEQAQRLESLGLLAGGVAHDFNNLLAVIVNYVGFLRDEHPEGSQPRADIEAIANAAQRGANLTEQLLAFGQRKRSETQLLDAGEVLAGMKTMLGPTLGGGIELRHEAPNELWPLHADPTDIEQITLNLVLNARDAFTDDGGLITTSAENVEFSGEQASHFNIPAGRYVQISVADDGCGIEPDTLAHVCEPFFTTKPPGEGSGLGLATVYGIARQAGGAVAISSEVDRGTQVDVYLPAADSGTEAGRNGPSHPTEAVQVRILLIEDDHAAREVIRCILERADYEVVVVSRGEQALDLLASDARFDLLLTDVIMPGMWGDDIASRARELVPGLPTLFMSGYGERFLRRGRATAPGPELTKPFRPEALLQQVSELVSTHRSSSENGTQSDRGTAENQRRSPSAASPAEGRADKEP